MIYFANYLYWSRPSFFPSGLIALPKTQWIAFITKTGGVAFMFTEKAQQLKDESNINSDSLDYSNIFVSEVEPFWFQLIEVAEWFGLSTYRNSNKILKKRTLFCYEKVTFKKFRIMFI